MRLWFLCSLFTAASFAASANECDALDVEGVRDAFGVPLGKGLSVVVDTAKESGLELRSGPLLLPFGDATVTNCYTVKGAFTGSGSVFRTQLIVHNNIVTAVKVVFYKGFANQRTYDEVMSLLTRVFGAPTSEVTKELASTVVFECHVHSLPTKVSLSLLGKKDRPLALTLDYQLLPDAPAPPADRQQ